VSPAPHSIPCYQLSTHPWESPGRVSNNGSLKRKKGHNSLGALPFKQGFSTSKHLGSDDYLGCQLSPFISLWQCWQGKQPSRFSFPSLPFFSFETGSCYVTQAGPRTCDPPASASLGAGITGVCYHALPNFHLCQQLRKDECLRDWVRF
jgi:hypothetical protein